MEENNTGNGNLGELPEDIQRWTAKRRAALVLSIVKGETTVVEAIGTRYHHLTFLGESPASMPVRRSSEVSLRWWDGLSSRSQDAALARAASTRAVRGAWGASPPPRTPGAAVASRTPYPQCKWTRRARAR